MNEYRDIVEALYGRDFQYATILDLESEGLACGSGVTDVISDSRALSLLKIYSEYINGVCGRWYEPFHLTFGLNVKDSTIFNTPNMIPIIELLSISRVFNGEVAALEEGSYRNNLTNIELVSGASRNLSNYLIDGVFGLLENIRILETALAQDFDLTSDLEIEVDDVSPGHKFSGISGISSNFQKGDLILFEDENGVELGRRIVCSVDYSSSMLEINPYLEEEIYLDTFPAGTTVKTYGRIPNIIRMAAVQFVIDNYRERASNQFWAEQLKRRIKSEKTDHYSWDTHTMQGGGGYGLPDVTLTSDPVINRGLIKYACPGWVRAL